jgi:hypothetical protein
MSSTEPNGKSTGENEALSRVVAELKLLNDRLAPLPWYKQGIGFPIAGWLLMFFGFFAQRDSLIITGAIFLLVSAILRCGIKR